MLLTGDRRLIGRWRSDRERTLAEWRFADDAPPEKRALVAGIFGKLELRYSRWRCQTLFDGEVERWWYEVLAKDAFSVMLRSWRWSRESGLTRRLSHLYFEEPFYWITLGSSREFFRRID